MNKHQQKLRLSLHTIFALIALVIIADFVLPGRVINDGIINVKKDRQQYYNAARNQHYSYKVITSQHQFSVTKNFAKLAEGHEKIEYSVSRIFEEVNWYRFFPSEKRAFYSLRIISGIVLPLLVIISILVAYRYKKNIDILLFALKVLLIADLIFLMI